MHWCMDETLAVLALIPFIGIFFGRIHAWWHKHFHHKCHEETCHEEHVEHTSYSPYDKEHWHQPEVISKEDAQYLSGAPQQYWPLSDCHPLPMDWDSISQDDAEGRFGGTLLDDLIGDLKLLRVADRPTDDEFMWWVNSRGDLKSNFRGRQFIHDQYCCEHGWEELDNDP